MNRFNEVKNAIYKYSVGAMAVKYPAIFPLDDEGFSEKIYWKKSRDEQPQKPFIILNDISKSKINKAFETYKIKNKTYQRENWRLIVTFSVYNQGNEGDFAQADLNAEEYIEYIELLFNSPETFEALQKNDIIVNEKEVSDIRDLSSFEQTNYSYRYEIDIVFDFDKIVEPQTYGIGKAVDIDINIKDTDESIKEYIEIGD